MVISGMFLDEEAFVHTVEHEWELTEAVAKCTGKDFTVRNASGAEDGEILSMLRKTEDGHILFPDKSRSEQCTSGLHKT